MLDLRLRWEEGELRFCVPGTGRPIATLEDERGARAAAEARADAEQARADTEQARADTAEARVRELEELLQRRDP